MRAAANLLSSISRKAWILLTRIVLGNVMAHMVMDSYVGHVV
jgi:hypothetical protein